MNIFLLDYDIKKCALYHCDKHINKMQLEHAQLLSTAIRIYDGYEFRHPDFKGKVYLLPGENLVRNSNGKLTKKIHNPVCYTATHINHPCGIWVRQSKQNWIWLRELTLEMNNVAKIRFKHDRDHKSSLLLMSLKPPNNIPDIKMTPFVLAMHDECKLSDPVKAYRNYYNMKKTKIAKWKDEKIPFWYKPQINKALK